MRCPTFDGPGTSARRFRGFFVLLLCSLSVLQPTLFWTLRSFRCCLPPLFCPSLLSTGVPLPDRSLVCSVMGALLLSPPRFQAPVRGTRLRRSLLSFGLFAPSGAACYSLLPLLALHGYAPAGWAPLYVPPWVPSFCFFPIPGSRPWYPAAAQPTLFWALRSFRRCLPTLLSPSSLSPGVLRPGGPPVCPLLFPDSRLPAVTPGRAQCPRPYPRPSVPAPLCPLFFAVQCAKCCISNFLVLILRKN